MLVPNQKITIKICSTIKSHYRNLGYDVKVGDVITVPIEHLSHGSCYKVNIICDVCGEIYQQKYSSYLNKRHENWGEIHNICPKCAKKFSKITYYEKTGYYSPFENPEVIEKTKQKNLEKYGYESPNQNPEVKRKKENNYFIKTGYKNPSQNPEVHDKKNDTYYKRTGYKYVGSSPEDRKKAMKTYYNKTGYKNPMQDPNNSRKTKPQIEIFNILKQDLYNVEMEVPLNRYSLDIVLNVKDCKIDIEYDGYNWHKNKQDFDRKRDNDVNRAGFKILRIKSGSKIPNKDELLRDIETLINEDDIWYKEIVLSDWEYRFNKDNNIHK